jgi:hypothetical protein
MWERFKPRSRAAFQDEIFSYGQPVVMAGPDPAIQPLDGRLKGGHDERETIQIKATPH